MECHSRGMPRISTDRSRIIDADCLFLICQHAFRFRLGQTHTGGSRIGLFNIGIALSDKYRVDLAALLLNCVGLVIL